MGGRGCWYGRRPCGDKRVVHHDAAAEAGIVMMRSADGWQR